MLLKPASGTPDAFLTGPPRRTSYTIPKKSARKAVITAMPVAVDVGPLAGASTRTVRTPPFRDVGHRARDGADVTC